MRWPSAALVFATATAMLTASCGDTPSPTAPTETTTTSSVTFIGTLDAGGARFYSFTLTTAGTVTALLASVTSTAGLPVSSALELGVGVPAGTGCAASTTQVVTAALLSQVSTSLPAGTFCLRVADTGLLAGPVTFAVRFTHP